MAARAEPWIRRARIAVTARPAADWEAARRRAFLLGLAPSLVVLATVTALPALALLVASFTPLSLVDPQRTFSFADPLVNYRELTQDPRFLASLWTQLRLSATSVTLQVGVGLGAALLLNADSRLLRAVRGAMLVPMVLPPIVVALVWKILYTPDVSPLHRMLEAAGWPLRSVITNPDLALWALAVAETWMWFPFTMLMALAALQMIPEEPLDAARLDGAGAWQLFVHIVLPHLRPVLVVCALFRLIDSFKAFPLIYVLTNGGPGTVTEVTNYYGFVQAFNFSFWGYGSAIATTMLAGVFALSWLVARLEQGRDDGR